MGRLAQGEKSWLEKILKLPNDVPRRRSFRRIFGTIDPKAFNACFRCFVEGLIGKLSSEKI